MPIKLQLAAVPLRRSLLAGASLLVLAGPVAAADLPMVAKAPPPAVAASWAGFYLGVHGGYGWKQDDFSQSDNFTFAAPQQLNGVKSQGAIYGGHVGYNWQFGRAVTGLELDFSATDIKGSNSISETNALIGGGTRTVTLSLAENVKYLGSARARLGWLPTDNVLLFGTAGLAWERLDSTASNLLTDNPPAAPVTQLLTTTTAIDKFGWAAGVGAEMMLGSPNWIGRVEYLHYDFGQIQTASSFDRVGGFRSDRSTAGSQTIDLVRAGVSYKFGEAAGIASLAYYSKAPVAAPQATWAGFYLGIHGGYGWGDDPFTLPGGFLMFPDGTAINGVKSKGWAAGGHMGHNWQYGRAVTGLEIDLSAADIKGASNTLSEDFGGGLLVSASSNERVKYLGTARGRLGWVPFDSLLLYGTAGLAWERLETGLTFAQTSPPGTVTGVSNAPSDRFGWVAGAGGEMMLGNSNWIGRVEYLHYDFGRIFDESSFSLSGAPPVSIASTAKHQTIDLVRAGVSYKFGPDVAVASAPAMYAKAPPVPVSTSWAGFYLGAHAGYGWKENDFSLSFFDTFIGGINSKGWLAGGQAGYNWQYASVVAGLEIDGSATGIKGSSATATDGVFNSTLSDDVKYLGTARARLGWTPAASWLLYGTGGLAWERVHRSSLNFSAFPGTPEVTTNEAPRDHFGWAAGAGVETFIGSSNWIARLEYLHYDFGTVETTFNSISTVPGDTSTIEKGGRQTIDSVRAGVSYKFTP